MRQKKRVRSCAQSRVCSCGSHVNIAYVCPRTSIERFLHSPLYTKNEEQPKLGARHSNSRGLSRSFKKKKCLYYSIATTEKLGLATNSRRRLMLKPQQYLRIESNVEAT